MTVFFYSGITSYPGVSTEEKTILLGTLNARSQKNLGKGEMG